MAASSKSSMSSSDHSHCTSFSSLSFDLPTSSPEQNAAALKPHRSSDSSFHALRNERGLSFRDFSLVRQMGSGDIGRVYLCRLRGGGGEGQVYGMKVVDGEVLALKKKVQRAETEMKIMRMLDHPFLPTLYAEFQAVQFSGVVMEYCSGDDLHSLRHKQPNKRFSLTDWTLPLAFERKFSKLSLIETTWVEAELREGEDRRKW
nr:protein kinase PINOID-like [Ipomoea trifida]